MTTGERIADAQWTLKLVRLLHERIQRKYVDSFNRAKEVQSNLIQGGRICSEGANKYNQSQISQYHKKGA